MNIKTNYNLGTIAIYDDDGKLIEGLALPAWGTLLAPPIDNPTPTSIHIGPATLDIDKIVLAPSPKISDCVIALSGYTMPSIGIGDDAIERGMIDNDARAHYGGECFSESIPPQARAELCKRWNEYPVMVERIGAAIDALRAWAVFDDDDRTTRNAQMIIDALAGRGGSTQGGNDDNAG